MARSYTVRTNSVVVEGSVVKGHVKDVGVNVDVVVNVK